MQVWILRSVGRCIRESRTLITGVGIEQGAEISLFSIQYFFGFQSRHISLVLTVLNLISEVLE